MGWILEYEDDEQADKAYHALHTKNFGQHKVKAHKTSDDVIIPEVSYVFIALFVLLYY